YVLTHGKNLVNDKSNGVFDLQDELSFMGDDVGEARAPTVWKFEKPAILRELRFDFDGENPVGPNSGSVFVGIYFRDPPPLSQKNYVVFDQNKAHVLTSRFRYKFDQKNYLVVEGVDMVKR